MALRTTIEGTDIGAIVKVNATRRLLCTYFGFLHSIPKGAEYVGFTSWSGYKKTDRMCRDCALRTRIVVDEEVQA